MPAPDPRPDVYACIRPTDVYCAIQHSLGNEIVLCQALRDDAAVAHLMIAKRELARLRLMFLCFAGE